MNKLSRPISHMRDHYSAVVVGSGYGGAVTAARLARAGRDVCVLERGREMQAGEFPESALSAAREIQAHTSAGDHGSETGLFDFHMGPDVTVLSGCGLGGTSLINAGVAIEPGDAVLADDRWPRELRHHPGLLRPFMKQAKDMLGSTPYPGDWPGLPRLRALERAAGGIGREVTRPDINVTFTGGPNAAGVRQNPCSLCGNCCSGCNHGAKNTVLMNYLPDAYCHGAHIFTEVNVRSVGRQDDGKWRVHLDAAGADGEHAPEFVTADVVVLAAGTLGSTQILLRSRDRGLALSDRLGYGFSGNGDVLAFAYDTDSQGGSVGTGRGVPRVGTLVGPTIAGLIDLRDPGKDQKKSLIIEDGAAPGALAAVLPLFLAVASRGIPTEWEKRLREFSSIPFGSHWGPVGHTLTYLVMSTDDAGGRIVADGDRISVDWPGVGQQPAFAHDNGVLAEATRALHGTEVPDPLWAWTHERSVISVHPLGGCSMADDAAGGVVDHKCRVFDPDGGVHDGLYVCDGSVIPLALDVNPLLTISAIAERAAELMIADRGWEARTGTAPVLAPPELAPPLIGLAFDERLTGYVSMTPAEEDESYRDGFERGRRDDERVTIHVTISYDNIHAVLQDPTHPGRITGTVDAPVLSPGPLAIAEGWFTLFEPDPSRVETWHMRYQMTLRADDGKRYRFEGRKDIREHGARHAWSDTTTLYTTISALGDADADDGAGAGGGRAPGKGILSLKVTDLIRMIRSLRVEGAPEGESGRYCRAFLELFGGEMVNVYGGVLDEESDFPLAPRQAPAVRGPGEPDGIWWCDGQRRWHSGGQVGQDAFLRLTRYRAGDKGPVMLAAGFGMSSHVFLAPTTEQNLTEFLAARGYDVWLFDYRAGIDLPSSGTEFTLDDIALQDWPLAVAQVLAETGRDDLQAFAHCVGSGSLLMALLAGLEGVRAGVCAQFPLHPSTSVFNQVKSRIHTAALFRRLGIGAMSPDTRRSVADELLDASLRVLPIPGDERCGQAICRWINAIYGMTHCHARLNDATHQALNGMFGVGNIESLDHLALMMRRGKAVTHTGGMDYFDHPERAAGTSLLLLQGAENYIFHPAGTLKTLHWLRQRNPRGDYHREVLDGYAHLDAIIGSKAAVDVYPRIVDFLSQR